MARQKTRKNSKVDKLLAQPRWQKERKKLRAIVLDAPLTEEVKWGKLCYTFENSNVAMIYGLKDHCALGFFKGALLSDADGLLVKPGENSQSMRWIKFAGVQDITDRESVVKACLLEAIEVEKAGLKVDFKEKNELVYPDEFQERLDENPELKTAFEALTPGRQRGYNLHFSGARKSGTRASRVEKCIPRILDGRGLNDR